MDLKTTVENSVVFCLDVKIPDNTTRLSYEKVGTHIPQEVFGGGVLKLFDKKEISGLTAARSAANTVLNHVGIKTPFGTVVPKGRAEFVRQELALIKGQFDQGC